MEEEKKRFRGLQKGNKKQEFKSRIERGKKRKRSSSSKGSPGSTPISFSRLSLWSGSTEDPWHFIGGTKDRLIVVSYNSGAARNPKIARPHILVWVTSEW
jgi:hypothetical protein